MGLVPSRCLCGFVVRDNLSGGWGRAGRLHAILALKTRGPAGRGAGGLSAACATRLFPGGAMARPDSWQDDAPPPHQDLPWMLLFLPPRRSGTRLLSSGLTGGERAGISLGLSCGCGERRHVCACRRTGRAAWGPPGRPPAALVCQAATARRRPPCGRSAVSSPARASVRLPGRRPPRAVSRRPQSYGSTSSAPVLMPPVSFSSNWWWHPDLWADKKMFQTFEK